MPKKIEKQCTGGVMDESLLDTTRSKINELGGSSDLEARISRMLGVYRFMAKVRDTEPDLSSTVRHLDQTTNLMEKLLSSMELVPEIAHTLAWERLYCAKGEDYQAMICGIQKELIACIALYKNVCERLKSEASRKGEKPKYLEHGLLSDVAEMIEKIDGIGVERAADYAACILINEKVKNMPNSHSEREGAARRVVIEHRKKAKPKD